MKVTDPRNGKQCMLDEDLSHRYAKENAEWLRQLCTHSPQRRELRRGTNRGGSPIVQMQCLDCGERVGPLVKRPEAAEKLTEFDDALNESYTAALKASRDKINVKYIDIQLRRWKGNKEGSEYYTQAREAYMNSVAWQSRRMLVMERAQGLCEGCRQSEAAEIHHLSYEHLGDEFLFELVALCRDCHSRYHAKGDYEALIEGCNACLHASKGHYCLRFKLPMKMALDAEGPRTFEERNGFEVAG